MIPVVSLSKLTDKDMLSENIATVRREIEEIKRLFLETRLDMKEIFDLQHKLRAAEILLENLEGLKAIVSINSLQVKKNVMTKIERRKLHGK